MFEGSSHAYKDEHDQNTTIFSNFVPFNIGKCMIKIKYIPKDSNI